jgi:hypothetical protein
VESQIIPGVGQTLTSNILCGSTVRNYVIRRLLLVLNMFISQLLIVLLMLYRVLLPTERLVLLEIVVTLVMLSPTVVFLVAIGLFSRLVIMKSMVICVI